MNRKVKKLIASVMVFLMVAAVLPLEYFFDAGIVANAATAGTTTYVFNVNDLDAAAFAGGYNTAITEDKTVGTSDYFKLFAKSSKVKLKEEPASYATNAFSQVLVLDGGAKVNQASVEFTVPEGKTAKVTLFAAAKSESASTLEYFAGGQAVLLDALKFGEVNKYTVNDLSAGTYQLGGTNGAFIYYLEVKYTEKYTFDTSSAAAGKVTADTPAGTSDFFTISGLGSKNEYKELAAPVTFGDKEYAKTLTLGGALNASTGKSGMKFTTTAPATVKVVASAKSSAASNLVYAPAGGAAIPFEDAALTQTDVKDYTIVNLPAGTYWLGGTNGGNIYEISVEYVDAYVLDPYDAATFDAVFDGTSGEMTQQTAVGTEDYFTLIPAGAKIKNPAVSLSYNGTDYTTALRLDGGAKVSGQACFKMDIVENARVTILAAGKNDKGSQFEYVPVGGSAFTVYSDPLKKDTVAEYVLEDLVPGSYYFGSTQGADIVRITVEYDATTLKAADWSTVQAPVINSVTTNADGDFVVDFAAVIDKVKGAEKVRVTMLEGGYEVRTEVVTSQKSQVVMKPLWSGNYSFVAVAQRTGEPDKASAAVAYNDYVLAVQKPVVRWAQSKGNGSLYIDWVNIEDADAYQVGYKASGAADYTMTDLPGTQGDYTFTGLAAGAYDIIVKALRSSDGFTAVYETAVTVEAQETQPWYVATVGSAQSTDAVITRADGAKESINLNATDTASNKTNLTEAFSIANTTGTIEMAAQSSGKISDDEDGFSYYFTKIDPDTENFKLGATFTIADISQTPDNQTGFGIVAADTLGINNWGAPDYVHKYFNYTSSMLFSSKSRNAVMRTVTGYSSADTSNNDGAERSVASQNFSQAPANWAQNTSYQFTLEKTDTGYTATCNGQTLSLDDNSFTSVQEDGTVCVGVMVSRKVGVRISDLTFTKSVSQGITSGGNKDEKITPNATIYSSETCGAQEYVYIYQPNCSGKLTVAGPAGTVISNQQVAAGEAVRVNVPISVGSNEIKSTFVPDAGDKISSTAPVIKTTKVDCQRYGKEGETIIVSPDGKADGKGTEESPLNLATAVKYAQPGQVLFLKNGTYQGGATIKRSVSGTPDKRITMVAETTGQVLFEGAGINLIGDYWHIYGMYVKDAAGVGIQISGNHNIIEMCTVEHSSNSGVQISRSGSADNIAGIRYELWPTGNLVKNCESFDNCDAGRNDADGFAAKLTCGNDNKFYGCIAHNNIDDGWDLYAKSVSGEIGSVTIENCVAYNNGWLTTDDITDPNYVYGEGNGFKLGGGYLKGGHKLINSISFDNHAKGITSNSCPDCQIINAISYNNSLKNDAYNVGLNTKDSNKKEWVVKGLISLNSPENTKLEDLIPFALHSADNYIYDGSASYNNLGVQATEDWFVNVDTSVKPSRNENGTINMHQLLELKETAPADTGARLDTTSDAAISVQPQKTTVVGGNENPDPGPGPEPGPDDNKDPVILDKNDTMNAVLSVKADADTIVRDNEGNSVDLDQLTLVITPAASENESKMNQAFTENNIVIGEGTGAKYFDISLVDASGNPVQIESGKIYVTFAFPAGTNADSHNYAVYHLNHDWVLENMNVNVTAEGLSAEIVSLSTFAVVYQAKPSVTPDVPVVPDVPGTPDGEDPSVPGTSGGEDPSVPTGDTMHMMPLVMVLLASGMAAAGIYVFDRKRKNLVRK